MTRGYIVGAISDMWAQYPECTCVYTYIYTHILAVIALLLFSFRCLGQNVKPHFCLEEKVLKYCIILGTVRYNMHCSLSPTPSFPPSPLVPSAYICIHWNTATANTIWVVIRIKYCNKKCNLKWSVKSKPIIFPYIYTL